MKKINKYPELRFPEFTDAWEQRKLGEVGRTQSGIGFPEIEQGGIEGIPFFKVSDMNNIGNEYEMTSANNFVDYNQLTRKKWKPIETVPAIIFAKVGAAIMLNRKRLVRTPFLIDNNTMAYIFSDKWDVLFGRILFETVNLPRYAQVGALPSYNSSDIESIEVMLPTLEEQTRIGSFFQEFDNLIAIHQRKLDALQEQKKGLLQKMFPKDGANVPEIRFPEFTEAWEQRKLGDYIIPFTEVTTENNQYPVFTSSRKGLFFQTDYYDGNQIASDDNTGYNIVPRGYFTYRHMSDDLVFKFNINNLADNGIVSTLYPVFTTTESLDSSYLQYQLNEGEEFKRFSILQKQGGSRTYMYLSKLKNMTLTMPILDEQIKISNFFKQLDESIAIHQRKLEALQEQKKGLLQQMFV